MMKRYVFCVLAGILMLSVGSCKKETTPEKEVTATVRFYANGGTFADGSNRHDTVVVIGKNVNKPQQPVQEGCSFTGWFVGKDLDVTFNFGNPIVCDTSIYAGWKDEGGGGGGKTKNYVDLGLSVKWGISNLGASNRYEFGDYYAWGELYPYYADGYSQKSGSEVVWRDFTTGAGNNPTADTLSVKGYMWPTYCPGATYSFTEWKNVPYDSAYHCLKETADAARQKLGEGWSVPTAFQWYELLAGTYSEWDSVRVSGRWVRGVKFTSYIYPSRSIFIPAAGFRVTDTYEFDEKDPKGYYWSSSLVYEPKGASIYAETACLDREDVAYMKDESPCTRYRGFCIRPVHE